MYCDCFGYNPLPEFLPGTGYDSNSHVFGLIAATGGVPSMNASEFYLQKCQKLALTGRDVFSITSPA